MLRLDSGPTHCTGTGKAMDYLAEQRLVTRTAEVLPPNDGGIVEPATTYLGTAVSRSS